jgi:hypothetical protein
VPRRDCIRRCGRGRAPACDRAGGDHHAARRVAQQHQDLAGERAAEAAPRLDRRPHHDKLGPVLCGDAGDVLAEAPRSGAHELQPDADAVRAGDGSRVLEPFLECHELAVEVRVDRQLTLEDGGRDQDDPGAAIGGEAAREVEGMLGLLPVEQRHDDAAIGDRARPASEAARTPVEDPEVRHLHRMSW